MEKTNWKFTSGNREVCPYTKREMQFYLMLVNSNRDKAMPPWEHC